MLADPETAEDMHGDEITLKHLMGEDDWETPAKQASDIPRPVRESYMFGGKGVLRNAAVRPLTVLPRYFPGP